MAQFHHYKHVFEPIKIGNMTVKNRIQFSPLVCSLSGTNGGVTREYLEFIKMQARTGAGIVTIGATSIDHDTGTGQRSRLRSYMQDAVQIRSF